MSPFMPTLPHQPAIPAAAPRVSFDRRHWMAALAIFVALGPGAISWINFAAKIGLDNVAAVIVILIAPFGLRPAARPPAVMVVIIAALIYVVAALTVRSDADLRFLVRPLIYMTAATLLSMVAYPRNMRRVVALAFASFMVMFFVSAFIAGVDLYQDVIRNLVTFDRRQFTVRVVRATLNAFAEANAETTASPINTFSAFILVCFAYFAAQGRVILALVAAFAIVILFSSSSMIPLAILLVMIVTGSIKSTAGWLRFLIAATVVGGALLIFWDPISSYIAANIDADSTSRSSRVAQYSYAIEQVNENPLFGNGQTRSQVGYIHNLILFVWSNSGLVPMLLLVVGYGLIGLMLLQSIVAFYRDQRGWLVVTALLLTFLLRTLVGGGGGLPVSIAAYALGLAMLEAGRLKGRSADYALQNARAAPIAQVVPQRRGRWATEAAQRSGQLSRPDRVS